MGKKIDHFVLSAATAAALYFYFQNAFHSRPVSVVLAFICTVLLSKLFHGFLSLIRRSSLMQRRHIRRCASGAMMRLACMPRAQAQVLLENLLRQDYSGEYAVDLIQSHPSAMLSRQQVFELWKAHLDQQRLVICATCPADSGVRLLASSLKSPRVALMDSAALAQLIAEHPSGMLPEKEIPCRKSIRHRFQQIAARLINRRNAPRSLLIAVSLFILYLLSGKTYYLISALSLVFLALISLKHASRPAKLF